MSEFLRAGRLEDHPFAELSGLIFQGSRTGELILESGNRRRTVWFLGGNPVAVVSDDPQDHLAQFLLEHGKIGAADAHRLADLPETREALGGADYLPKETLNWGVKSRFVNLCYDLFRWEDGDYRFHEGDPPRELFLLKVPAHSLIFKGVGLLGQAAVFDAVPDDAVCRTGPVPPDEARYLNPDALQLLEQCQSGRTAAEVLDSRPDDRDQARRLLYALACLGLVAIAREPAVAEFAAPLEETGPGFIFEEEAAAASLPPALEASPASREPDGFSLDLPPLGAEYDSPSGPIPDFDSSSTLPSPASYTSLDDAGPGSWPGTFESADTDLTRDQSDEPPAAQDEEQSIPEAAAKPAGRRLHIPRILGIALGSFAAAGIILLAGWWWMSESEPPPSVKPPVKRPAATDRGPIAAAPVPGPVTQAVVPAPSPVPAVPPPPAAAAPASPATAPGAGASAPRSAEATSGASGRDLYRNGLESFRTGDLDAAAAAWESLLAAEHRSAFTLQLLTACQHDTVRDAQRSLAAQELYLVTKKLNGRVCFRVCLGTFDSREAAGRVLAQLPVEYRTGGAVRLVADVLNRDR